MPPAGFEPAIPASERPQTHALDREANLIDFPKIANLKLVSKSDSHYITVRLHLQICVD